VRGLSALTPRARGVKERNDTRTGKNGDEGAFLAGEVIIHVGRDKGNLEGCSKTHEEMAETDVALGNKARRARRVRIPMVARTRGRVGGEGEGTARRKVLGRIYMGSIAEKQGGKVRGG